jgi:hypothetical protein
LLADALAGTLAAGDPRRPVAEQVAGALSELERGVCAGAPWELDPVPVRRAAAMRLRVAAALAARPPPGSPVDGQAVEALLAELDAGLAAVNALSAAAPEARRPALEAIRHALVKEAEDFSEACHEIGPAEPAAQRPEEGAGPAARAAAGARVLSIQGAAATGVEVAATRRGRALWVVLALAVLVAAGAHGYRWYRKEQGLNALRSLPGAPEGMMLVPGPPAAPKVLLPMRGPPERAQVERFRAQQKLKGNKVTELPGGGLAVEPETPPGPPGRGGSTP